MATLEDKLLELVAIKRIGTYREIAEYENITEQEAKKKYKGIYKFYCNILNINDTKLLEIQENISDKKDSIDKLFRNQFSGNEKRKDGFGSFESFYKDWYVLQNNKCYYCGITSERLKELFNEEKLKSYKFNETLHIEQLNPKEGYVPANCKLACSLCNNTKSDLISKENYKKYFAKSMSNFLNDLYENKIENNTF